MPISGKVVLFWGKILPKMDVILPKIGADGSGASPPLAEVAAQQGIHGGATSGASVS